MGGLRVYFFAAAKPGFIVRCGKNVQANVLLSADTGIAMASIHRNNDSKKNKTSVKTINTGCIPVLRFGITQYPFHRAIAKNKIARLKVEPQTSVGDIRVSRSFQS